VIAISDGEVDGALLVEDLEDLDGRLLAQEAVEQGPDAVAGDAGCVLDSVVREGASDNLATGQRWHPISRRVREPPDGPRLPCRSQCPRGEIRRRDLRRMRIALDRRSEYAGSVTRVLFLYGGFPGHRPYEVATWARGLMDELGFEVEEIQDPHRFEDDLTGYDLIVLGWTQSQTTEDLTDRAEQRLIEAARAGTGFAGWHGMTASFRASLPYSWIVGADFVEHPGGEAVRVPFEVKIVDRDHPVTRAVEDFTVESEQYYMHVDPGIHVLATTTFDGEPGVPWMAGVEMPAVYVKEFGQGRVFYAMGGHEVEEMERPEMTMLVKQGMEWAARHSRL
jgi:hypothetical protein